MRRVRILSVNARAILGVVALYGLLLQGVLSAAIPPPSPDLAGAICASHEAGPSSSPDAHDMRGHACCTVADAGALAPPPAGPSLMASALAVSRRAARRLEPPPRETGPPTHAHSARGPPSA